MELCRSTLCPKIAIVCRWCAIIWHIRLALWPFCLPKTNRGFYHALRISSLPITAPKLDVVWVAIHSRHHVLLCSEFLFRTFFTQLGLMLFIFSFPIRFDAMARYAFIGDFAGQITMLRLDVQGSSLITTFKGHTGEKFCYFERMIHVYHYSIIPIFV